MGQHTRVGFSLFQHSLNPSLSAVGSNVARFSALVSEIVPLESVVYHTFSFSGVFRKLLRRKQGTALVEFREICITLHCVEKCLVVIFSVLYFQKKSVSTLFFVFQIQDVPIMKYSYDN